MTQGHIIVIKPDGSQTQELVQKPPNLAESQKLVGGYIEVVPGWNQWFLKDYGFVDAVVICDEEGKLRDKPLNQKATGLWRAHAGQSRDVLVGDIVVIAGSKEFIEEWGDGE